MDALDAPRHAGAAVGAVERGGRRGAARASGTTFYISNAKCLTVGRVLAVGTSGGGVGGGDPTVRSRSKCVSGGALLEMNALAVRDGARAETPKARRGATRPAV